MRIKLISKENYDKLLSIQQDFPNLTYQNKGYDTIDKKNLSEGDFEAVKTVSNILLESVGGFRLFNNFRLTHDNKIQIRFQYNYNYGTEGYPFIKTVNMHSSQDEQICDVEIAENFSSFSSKLPFVGVGYIILEELLNGF